MIHHNYDVLWRAKAIANASKFEIHYYLNDDSHSVDALVRNNCEASFLAIAYDIISELELPITLEAEALSEGGVREVWKFIGKNSNQITIILMSLAIICQTRPDPELTELQKLDLQLNIMEKLRQEIKEGELSPEILEESIRILSQDPKIIVRKSQFYKNLSREQKVEKVGYSILDDDNQPIESEKYIKRNDFVHFILRNHKLPTEIIEDAKIEIVSPVILEGNTRWKGIYSEPPAISFGMNDLTFKDAVLSGQISFKSGDVIVCVLEVHKELSEAGAVKIKKYAVTTVLDKIENGVPQETKSGQIYRRNKKLESGQQTLHFK